MMLRPLSRLLNCDAAAAAAEMALVAPLLITLMFGSFELGNFFLSEHVVVKAVRDGARYASRISMSNYDCPAGATTGSITGGANEIGNIARTGTIDGSADPRLSYWTNNTDWNDGGDIISIAVECKDSSLYSGIYRGITGKIPVVTVRASVTYQSLFSRVGLFSGSVKMNAESHAAVTGV